MNLKKINLLTFLDILLINKNERLEFKVHHKTNSRNDYIHYFSNHNYKIKRDLINLFLRALRICTLKHIKSSLKL